MKIAFSKPTADAAGLRELIESFRKVGYEGLQLKGGQYYTYLDEPDRFVEEWGSIPGVASGLITGGVLDADGIAELRKVYRFAKRVGAELVIYCHAVPREDLSDTQIRAFAAPFAELAAEGRAMGTKLSLHHHYNNPVMYRKDFDTFFGSVEDNSVGLTVDTAHLVASGVTDIADIIRSFAHVIDNFHLKDFADGGFRVLGQGGIDFEPVFEAIRDIGYDGWVSADEESGSDIAGAMTACYDFMKRGLSLKSRR